MIQLEEAVEEVEEAEEEATEPVEETIEIRVNKKPAIIYWAKDKSVAVAVLVALYDGSPEKDPSFQGFERLAETCLWRRSEKRKEYGNVNCYNAVFFEEGPYKNLIFCSVGISYVDFERLVKNYEINSRRISVRNKKFHRLLASARKELSDQRCQRLPLTIAVVEKEFREKILDHFLARQTRLKKA